MMSTMLGITIDNPFKLLILLLLLGMSFSVAGPITSLQICLYFVIKRTKLAYNFDYEWSIHKN